MEDGGKGEEANKRGGGRSMDGQRGGCFSIEKETVRNSRGMYYKIQML